VKRFLLVALLVALAAACQPQHFGASIMNQARNGGYPFQGPVYATPGDDAVDVAGSASWQNRDRNAGTVIADVEHNAVADDLNWSSADRLAYAQLLPATTQCTVVVLGGATGVAWADALDDARESIRALAQGRQAQGYPVVITDWQAIVQDAWLAADNVHLGNVTGVDQYGRMIDRALAECP
jgi:hypothetical protein